jgi:peptidoglycan/xylan/chitin deacetylase (PgdA/CDA1 family)
MFLKRIIKDFLAVASFLIPRDKGIPILMYHSIDNNDVFFTVKPEVFVKQMKYLKDKNYQVISLAKLVEILESKNPLPDKAIVITFDDGYQDNYTNAWPVLKKHNFPATIFLTTGLIGQEMTTSQGSLPMLNWSQIEEMHHSGLIDFQPHTVSHQRFDRLKLSEIEQEIVDSQKMIEEKLNKKCYFFAYPKGWYNQEIIEILKKHGFKAARTLETGKTKKGDDLFKLKRISVNSTISFIQFKAKL